MSTLTEEQYTLDHPEVIFWTDFFLSEANKKDIFSDLTESSPVATKYTALVVGSSWHKFSEFMPKLLTHAATSMHSNEKRHYITQVAWEELGEGNINNLHCDLFEEALTLSEVTQDEYEAFIHTDYSHEPIRALQNSFLKLNSDSEILGLCLGLEIIAIENIETIYWALAHTPEVAERISATKFFKIHRFNETEHIRLNISNYLKFCSTPLEKDKFKQGFDEALKFWEFFWDGNALTINNLDGRSEKHQVIQA